MGETVNVFTLFRISVVTPLVLTVLGVTYSFLAEPFFPENWKNLIEWSGDGSVFPDDAHAASPWIWLLFGLLALREPAMGSAGLSGSAYGIRTRAPALRGLCPNP